MAELADLSSQHIRRKWIFSVLIASPQSSGFLRGVCMKKVFSFLISLALGAIFLIPKIITLASQEMLLLYVYYLCWRFFTVIIKHVSHTVKFGVRNFVGQYMGFLLQSAVSVFFLILIFSRSPILHQACQYTGKKSFLF